MVTNNSKYQPWEVADDTGLKKDHLSPTKFYGIRTLNGSGFVTMDGYKSGLYKCLCLDELTVGNSFLDRDCSLQDLIESFLKKGAEVVEFKTFKGLAQWLAAD